MQNTPPDISPETFQVVRAYYTADIETRILAAKVLLEGQLLLKEAEECQAEQQRREALSKNRQGLIEE